MYFALRLNLYSARTQTYEMAYARVPTVTIDLPIILVATQKLIKLSMKRFKEILNRHQVFL